MGRLRRAMALKDTDLLELMIATLTFRLGVSMFTPVQLFDSHAYYLVQTMFAESWIFGVLMLALSAWWLVSYITYNERHRMFAMLTHAATFLMLTVSTMIVSALTSPAWTVYLVITLFAALVYKRLRRVV